MKQYCLLWICFHMKNLSRKIKHKYDMSEAPNPGHKIVDENNITTNRNELVKEL